MIEVAHRKHNNSTFTFQSSKSASASHLTSDRSLPPLRHLKTPSSPLINTFTSTNTYKSSPLTSSAGEIKSRINKSDNRTSVQYRVPAASSGPSSPVKDGPTAANSAPSSTSKPSRSKSTMSASTSISPKSSSVHRIRRGQKMEDFQPPALTQLPPVQSIDSAFQLQEYLSALLRQDVQDVERIIAVPQPSIDPIQGAFDDEKGKARENENPFGSMEEEAPTIDTDVWIYEQLRRIVLDFSTPWLTMLQRECDKKNKSCEAMNADDWMYLCASHGEEKQCCAIDYMIHTLDGTTALLNSQRHFPSRTYIPTTSLRHFGSACRRMSRIFVHAYEHHRDVFEVCEAETALYARFLALVQTYDLIHVDSLPRLGKDATKLSLDPKRAMKAEGGEPKVQATEILQDHNARGGEKGLLFEADVAIPTDEDDEEEEDDVLEEEVEGKEELGSNGDLSTVEEEVESRTLPSVVESRPQRSDSIASRITAIDLNELTNGNVSERAAEVKEVDDQSMGKIHAPKEQAVEETKEEEDKIEKPQSIL